MDGGVIEGGLDHVWVRPEVAHPGGGSPPQVMARPAGRTGRILDLLSCLVPVRRGPAIPVREDQRASGNLFGPPRQQEFGGLPWQGEDM